MNKYPWYQIVHDNELHQGDIILSCPLPLPPSNIKEGNSIEIDIVEYDVIIMSQSCDLINKKLDLVLTCPICTIKEFEEKNPNFKDAKLKESLRRGYLPGYHLLNNPETKYFNDYLVVDFRNAYSVSFNFLIKFIGKSEEGRLRLLPPYREHLSQAFARFFMRVGLPADIPPFK